MTRKINGKKKPADFSVSRPSYKKRKPSFQPGMSTREDQISQQIRKQFSSTADKEQAFYYAEVLRIDSQANANSRSKKSWDWFKWYEKNPVRVRARIKDSELAAAHPFPRPKDENDQHLINLHPEFVGFLDDIGGTEPKVGDIIKVSFKNPDIKSKIIGNGIIVALGESVTKVVEGTEGAIAAREAAVRSHFSKAGVTDRLSACESLKKSVETTVKPSFGGLIKGLLDDLTQGSNNPRQLNNPTDDQGIDPVSRQPAGDTSAPSRPTAKDRDPAPPGPNLVGHPPFAAAPRGSNSTPSSCVECDVIYTNRDFTGGDGEAGASGKKQPKQKKSSEPDSTAKMAQPQSIPKTGHRLTDQLIKQLHPDIRKQTADFIRDARSRGYNIKITATYRTFPEQDQMRRRGVSKARGGQSYHNYGIAFDVVENPQRGIPFGFDERYPKKRWHDIGRMGKEHGFEWGGEFRGFFDGPHFQIGVTRTRDMYRRVMAGKTVEDPKQAKVGPFDPSRPSGPRNYIYPDLDGIRR